MLDPRLLGEITRLLGGGQGAAEPTDQIEPATCEDEQAVKRPQQPQLLFEAAVTIQPLGQAKQGVDLGQERARLEQSSLGRRPKELMSPLDLRRDRLRVFLELLECRNRRREFVGLRGERVAKGLDVLVFPL